MKGLVLITLVMIVMSEFIASAQTGAAPGENLQAPVPGLRKAPPSTASHPGDERYGDCGCETQRPSDAVAVVNGARITRQEIDEPIKNEVAKLHRLVVNARKRQVGLEIDWKLLRAEAKKRGISRAKLIEQEIQAKLKEPTEAEVKSFYARNRARFGDDFTKLRDQLIDHLRNQRRREETKKLTDRLRAAADVKFLVANPTPPKEDADRARILATVNGEEATSGLVEDSLRPLIFDVQQQLYFLRRKQLNSRIAPLLLEQEAQRRKITSRAVLEAEVFPRMEKVTEKRARSFYEHNKEKMAGDFEQVKYQVIHYLQERERQKAEVAYTEKLWQTASIKMLLKAPEPPVYSIATDDQPARGNADAPVTIIEFTDYECPTCARMQRVLERLAREYGDHVRLVARDFPLEQHKNAFRAAEAAEAARAQGKYWEYAGLLFENHRALREHELKEYAGRLGLDRKKFDAALDSGECAEKVQRDILDGSRIGVNSAPTVFINGQRVTEKTYDSLKVAIEKALKNPAKK